MHVRADHRAVASVGDGRTNPTVSIVIPSRSGDVDRTMRSIRAQTLEVCDVDIVRERGLNHSRNVGVRRSSTDFVVLIDDDIVLGHEHVLEKMVALLRTDSRIGVVGVSLQVPPEANRFQQLVARQVPRYVDPVVAEDLRSNPPLGRYGFTAVKGGCCAIRRRAFDDVGGFDEDQLTGEDTEFFYRLRRRGYELALAANSWAYHAPPASMKELLQKSFGYGVGHAREARKSPERGMALLGLDHWYGPIAVTAAIISFPIALFVHYYFDPQRRLVFGFRPLKTLSTYATLVGYVYGWRRVSKQA